MRRCEGFDDAYQATTDEKYRDRQMLEILSRPLVGRTAEVLEEDVGDAINEDQRALDKFRRWSPCLA